MEHSTYDDKYLIIEDSKELCNHHTLLVTIVSIS